MRYEADMFIDSETVALNEFYPAHSPQFSDKEEDSLDDNHPFLCIG